MYVCIGESPECRVFVFTIKDRGNLALCPGPDACTVCLIGKAKACLKFYGIPLSSRNQDVTIEPDIHSPPTARQAGRASVTQVLLPNGSRKQDRVRTMWPCAFSWWVQELGLLESILEEEQERGGSEGLAFAVL